MRVGNIELKTAFQRQMRTNIFGRRHLETYEKFRQENHRALVGVMELQDRLSKDRTMMNKEFPKEKKTEEEKVQDIEDFF